MRLPTLGAWLLVGTFASAANAQNANDAAAAEALFDQGRKLMTAGNYAAACPKFAESLRLDAGLGTTLWLAECYERQGKLASAWAQYREAESIAAGQRDARGKIAHEGAVRLEPKLSRLTVAVASGADVPGIEIKRDGVIVGKPQWGVSVPLDPGAHRLSASAPGKRPWETTVDVPGNAGISSITVPPLVDAPASAPTAPSGQGASGAGGNASTLGDSQRTIGIVVGAAGLVAAGVGAYFGLRTKAKLDDSNANAHCLGTLCDDAGYDLRSDARRSATISNIAFGVGAGALIAAGVLYFTAPRSRVSAGLGFSLARLAGGAGILSYRW